MVKVLSKRDFISSLKEIVKVNENKSYSDKLKEKMFDNFVEAYAPEEREMFEIQDMNTGEYIVKVEEGQEFPFASVDKGQFARMEYEDKYFSGHELQFINNGSYKITSVGKW
ncbi:hypothetical protein LW81_032 [Lactococcus phage LW81]|uniref:Uncharacterized protein n=1 Tax=Lactococcus phage LW81 TaxID=1965482 RepID=A0A1W6JN28_9CAUD|nr:hypothetical protein H1Z34_gp032 [Lactococcus phage LW81]ARM67602.1 hypothetical protein LW81_032 [Lactococcus phage LW81]